MKQTTLSLPGKTFLAGEYLALLGGPSFILCTAPRFELSVQKNNEGEQSSAPFHPDSPAGRLWAKYPEQFGQFQFQFHDPYQGAGGFGASSAQFGLLHAVLQMGDEIFGDSQYHFDWHQTLTEYRELGRADSKSLPPSGADVVGVMMGGIAFFDRNSGHTQRFVWPFPKLKLTLFHTGEKLATHEHLKTLKIFETDQFQAASLQILKGLSHVNEEIFVQGLKKYRNELVRQNRVTKKSLDAISQFESLPDVLLAKGCGAMGSDVMLVIHQENAPDVMSSQILNLGKQLGFRWIANEDNISSGLLVENDNRLSQVLTQTMEAHS